MKKHLFLWGLAFAAASCGVSTHYIGKSYPATASPDLFFDWADVPCAYETMGRIEASPRLFRSIEDAQTAIEQKAREKGADGVVFTGIRNEVFNPTVTVTENTERDLQGGETRTITSSQDARVVEKLQATFIKYKP